MLTDKNIYGNLNSTLQFCKLLGQREIKRKAGMEECEGCVKSEQEIYSYDADKASCICQCRYEFQT